MLSHEIKQLYLHELSASSETLVVCATSRLAQTLRQQRAIAEIQSGSQRWPTLRTTTFDQWLAGLHDEISLQGLGSSDALRLLPIDSWQEQIAWERVILDNLGDEAHCIFDTTELAKTAMEAHKLCVVWGMQPQSDQLTEESSRFLNWQQCFLAQCQREGWIDTPSLHHALINELPHCFNAMRWPERVAFAGFTRMNPLEKTLLAMLAAWGIETVELRLCPPGIPAAAHSRSYPDTASEALAAALWVQATLEAKPKAKLAIVVPDVSASRHILQDTIEDVLMPSAISPSQAESPRPFNISLGLPLSGYPVVHTALALLRVVTNAHHTPQTALQQLLLSPYWSQADSEGDARALLDAALRKRLGTHVTLSRYLQTVQQQMAAENSAHLQAPVLLQHLQSLADAASILDTFSLPSEWAREILPLLHRCGWLHQRKLSSHEFQAKNALSDSIAQLGRLDDFLGEVDFSQIVLHLCRHCQERTFQPKTDHQPQVQILGLLEASGLFFDGVWVMGMVDTAWPPPARPNALLPSALQRHCQSPGASATVQLAFAQTLQSHLNHCAAQVIFSWPRKQGESELSPSPLIPPTPENGHLPCPASPHWTRKLPFEYAPHLAPPVPDFMAPALANGERAYGGTWMLRAQAICPAWAFFQFRLGAGKLEEPIDGLDSRQRGTLLHAALEHFWNTVQTSTRLNALSPEAQVDWVEASVDSVLSAHNRNPGHASLSPALTQLERVRLTQLVLSWLEVELERKVAFSVLHTEQKCAFDIEGIQGRVTIDRIDQLADGSLVVIDYKTGQAIDTKNWASQRLTEPQLPIYALIHPHHEGQVSGVVFAKVLMKKPGFAGLTSSEKMLPSDCGLDSRAGRKLFPRERFPTWNDVLAHWRERICAVAREVKAGDAGVRFEDKKALQYCDIKPLLRMAERQSQLDAALANTKRNPEDVA